MNWEDIKESRFNGIVEQIDFYAWKFYEVGKLSLAQKKHLKELRQQISVFGERAQKWEDLCEEMLYRTKFFRS